ncbi:MAG TPA: phytanoyl-CoA dioxygenase family protein [Gemmataceae bacterium]|nr:phytanoyl-CoA dioxygenase family protein [Gemmataceae bacterium]
MMTLEQPLAQISRDGFAVIRAVYSPDQVAGMRMALEHAFHSHATAAPVRSDAGHVYAARNVLHLWPPAVEVADQPPLPELLTALLGPGYGVVRALFFDKPPERTWALPWHKDLTVSLRENRPLGGGFTKPTIKAGVPHAEAPTAVLEGMVTVRIHLDDVTEENGPLKVLPGSHRTGK